MDDVNMIYVKGSSGERYRFFSFSELSNLKKAGGIYMLAKKNKRDSKASYEVIHIGETEDMSMLSKEQISASVPEAFEANCYCIHMDDDEESRSRTLNDIKDSFTIDFT